MKDKGMKKREAVSSTQHCIEHHDVLNIMSVLSALWVGGWVGDWVIGWVGEWVIGCSGQWVGG